MNDSEQMELIPSTSLQEDILANLSPSQVAKKVSKIRDTSGQNILDLSKNSNQLGLLEKMLVDTLNSVSTPYSRTWRVKVTPRGRLVFQLLASAPTTKEKESGHWPTPTTKGYGHASEGQTMIMRRKVESGVLTEEEAKAMMNGVTLRPPRMKIWMWPTPTNQTAGKGPMMETLVTKEGKPVQPNERAYNPKTGKHIQITLDRAIKLWPTPQARDWKGSSGRSYKGQERDLPTAAKQSMNMWPTPQATDGTRANQIRSPNQLSEKAKKGGCSNLRERVMFPTPTANEDACGRPGAKMQKMLGNHPEVRKPLGGGTLNPTWVEWLMGYPKGWTDLKD